MISGSLCQYQLFKYFCNSFFLVLIASSPSILPITFWSAVGLIASFLVFLSGIPLVAPWKWNAPFIIVMPDTFQQEQFNKCIWISFKMGNYRMKIYFLINSLGTCCSNSWCVYDSKIMMPCLIPASGMLQCMHHILTWYSSDKVVFLKPIINKFMRHACFH